MEIVCIQLSCLLLSRVVPCPQEAGPALLAGHVWVPAPHVYPRPGLRAPSRGQGKWCEARQRSPSYLVRTISGELMAKDQALSRVDGETAFHGHKHVNACIVGGHQKTRLRACLSQLEPVGHHWWDLGWGRQRLPAETASGCISKPRLYLIAWLAEALFANPTAGTQARLLRGPKLSQSKTRRDGQWPDAVETYSYEG